MLFSGLLHVPEHAHSHTDHVTWPGLTCKQMLKDSGIEEVLSYKGFCAIYCLSRPAENSSPPSKQETKVPAPASEPDAAAPSAHKAAGKVSGSYLALMGLSLASKEFSVYLTDAAVSSANKAAGKVSGSELASRWHSPQRLKNSSVSDRCSSLKCSKAAGKVSGSDVALRWDSPQRLKNSEYLTQLLSVE